MWIKASDKLINLGNANYITLNDDENQIVLHYGPNYIVTLNILPPYKLKIAYNYIQKILDAQNLQLE
jgi:hypothetical protein